VKCIIQAIELCEQIGDPRNLAQCIRDLGGVYLDMGDYAEASQEFHRAYELCSSGSDMEVCASSRLYLAGIAAREGDRTLAREYAEDAVRIKKEISEQHGLQRTLVLAAEILIETGSRKRAGEILAEAEKLIEEGSGDETAGRYRVAMSLLKASEGPEGAADELRSILEDLSDHEELAAEVYQHLYGLTKDTGYRREAIERYTALRDKVPKMKYTEKLNLLETLALKDDQ